MKALCIHMGGHQVPREALAAVETPRPTQTWHPLPHERLVEEVETALAGVNLRVTHQAHALAHEGARYFGVLEIGSDRRNDTWSWLLGLRNSHDQSLSAGLVAGSRVFVCDNLAFSGEVRIMRKHTSGILRDIRGQVARAVARLVERWHSQDRRLEAYRLTGVSDPEAHDLVVRALDAGAITATQVPKVLQEWRKPSHEAFRERTAWSLFNAHTEVLKGGSFWQLPGRTETLHGLLDSFTGLDSMN